MDRIYTNSAEEADRLVKLGYAIISISGFTSGNGLTYGLEIGSEWSRALGSK